MKAKNDKKIIKEQIEKLEKTLKDLKEILKLQDDTGRSVAQVLQYNL